VPAYKLGGFTANISLLAGFEIEEQIIVSSIDISWISITSVDAVVVVDGPSMTESIDTYTPMIAAINGGKTPKIGFAFTFTDLTNGDTHTGVYSTGEGSVVESTVLDMEYCGGAGILITDGGSVVCSTEVKVSNGGSSGVVLDNNATIRGFGLLSVLNAEDGLVMNDNSLAEFGDDVDCNSNTARGITMSRSCTLTSSQEIVSVNNGAQGLNATRQCTVQGSSMSISNNGDGIFLGFTSHMRCAVDMNATNNGDDFIVDYASRVEAGSFISTAPHDLNIFRGSIVSRAGGSGGTNVSTNSISANGILFDY
jgi:hypothetical protein